MEFNVKKVLRRIYQLDFSNCLVKNKEEFYTEKGVSTFAATFKKTDFDNGIVVTPNGYKNGLFYSVENGGEIYSPTKFTPDLVTFSLNIYGLKKGAYYKITIPSRSAGTLNIITDNRKINITTDAEDLVMDADLTGINESIEQYGIFRASSNEINLFFTLGKVIISNIIIDEVELASDTEKEELQDNSVIEDGKYQLAAYGVFNVKPSIPENFNGKYIALSRYTGRGINLYYNKSTYEFILERDNANDILNESFNLLNYTVEINTTKVINNKKFIYCDISSIEMEPSPNTLKQGYIKFAFVTKDGNNLNALNLEGRISIIINKIY